EYNQLSDEFGYINAEFRDINFTPAERLAKKITGPVFSVILLTLGFVALMFEILAPGFGVGGTVGILSLSLFFSSYVINGYAGWGLVILFLAGLGLLLLELLVIPGFGITGIGGIAAMVTSLMLIFPSVEIAVSVLALVLVFSLTGFYILWKVFGSSKIWNHLSLGESQTQETGYTAQSNKKEIIGKEGKTETPLRPAGIAVINNERVDVITEGDFIGKGEKIKVIEVKGNRVIVKKN
ncbi:MAG: NfeD family protein, partial [Bacillota bacterium]